ncbi:type III pantothenate kinase [Winogradskyella immobilis]|uniref:Type III pantothenate kinase n=1 Tax=Winogradskyella immobilis TaxID=2816852 RepID=A0ABS8EIZ6_9FLAO|nr:type III pantothenate kinase [Winogradskyella immobilis]MCC1483173.1 type III pantothenate kinase [Winogradskyella immobilis]MCG0015268.1 type III pantothenate kinase [Winogradskyella immobilis]
MNLVIDVGNTFIKFAVFGRETLEHKVRFKSSHFIAEFKAVKEAYPNLKRAIISSVGNLKADCIELATENIDLITLDAKTKLPFINSYKTPKTLGVDRIALVSASVKEFPKKNVLIIDAGTCVTYDFITDKNEYLGGAISPGIRLRYQTLHNLTANLPLLKTSQPENIIGNTTESAIHSGIVNGIIKEIDGVIDEYRHKYSDLTIILTGGDAKFLSNQLKNSIFANSNFLLEGLNFILEFNSK